MSAQMQLIEVNSVGFDGIWEDRVSEGFIGPNCTVKHENYPKFKYEISLINNVESKPIPNFFLLASIFMVSQFYDDKLRD